MSSFAHSTASAPDLSLRQLQYLVAVADTKGFHRAAEQCHVSQPTLSAQVQHIEAALGVRVFERTRRGVVVTPVGEDILVHARRVLGQVQELVAAAGRARDPLHGTLRVGVIPTIAPYLLPHVLPAFGKAFPHLRMVLREEMTEDIVRGLQHARLDAGIVALEAELPDCSHAVVARDPFVVAMPRGHALARKKRITLEHLEGETVLLLEDGHCFRQQALPLCSSAGLVEADLRATSLATMAQMVSAGIGITLLPAISLDVENRQSQLDLRPLDAPGAARTIVVVWRKAAAAPEAYRALARVAADALTALVGRRRTSSTPSSAAKKHQRR